MKVFKFGGAAVNSIERIKNIAGIMQANDDDNAILIVISAMGKTTNALEHVAEVFYNGRQEEAWLLFEEIKKQHINTAKYILVTGYLECEIRMKDFFTEVEWLLHDKPTKEFDYYYDQIVPVGELLSTCIVSAFFNETGISNFWLDVRDIFRTDDNFRDANINWNFTQQKVNDIVLPLLKNQRLIITQGFIGATDENESTTLGREGSDYSAAIFANMINAENLTIWKDVENIMSADPKEIPQAQPLPQLNYNEIIEMAYYGAQVIHPKTIKPIQNKNIPLYVKCFIKPSLPGTIIHNQIAKKLPPIIVIKKNQVVMELRSKDFSFITDHNATKLYHLFDKLSMHPNLSQNGAINMICVFDNKIEKINQIASEAALTFDVVLTPDLSLITIRHYNEETVQQYTAGKDIIIKQETRENIQLLYRN